MYKTAFALRNGKIDSSMTVEWPEGFTSEGIKTLAEMRGESSEQTFRMLLPEHIVDFCTSFNAMKVRAAANSLQGPYVVSSEEKPTDSQLIAFARRQRNSTTKGK